MKRVQRSKKCAITRRNSGSAKLAMISSSGESRTWCAPSVRVRGRRGRRARRDCAMARRGRWEAQERERRRGERSGVERAGTADWNIRDVELCEYALTSASSATHWSIDCAHER
jgi:hypothetical protein